MCVRSIRGSRSPNTFLVAGNLRPHLAQNSLLSLTFCHHKEQRWDGSNGGPLMWCPERSLQTDEKVKQGRLLSPEISVFCVFLLKNVRLMLEGEETYHVLVGRGPLFLLYHPLFILLLFTLVFRLTRCKTHPKMHILDNKINTQIQARAKSMN